MAPHDADDANDGSFAPSAERSRAWFEENARVTVHLQHARGTADARMARVCAAAAEDATRALTRANDSPKPSPRVVRAVDAGVMTDAVQMRECGTLARATCRVCAANVRALRDAHSALRAIRARERELNHKISSSAIAFGSSTTMKPSRESDGRRSTLVNIPSDVVRTDARRVCIPDTISMRALTKTHVGELVHDVAHVSARHARKTALMARRSRERRAARAAAASSVPESNVSRDVRTGRGKPDWNDCVDLNASPRIKTNDEHLALLRQLVAAKDREEKRINEERAREKRRRRAAAVAAAATAAREAASKRFIDDQARPMMRARRASFDSLRSFKSAAESVGCGARLVSDEGHPP